MTFGAGVELVEVVVVRWLELELVVCGLGWEEGACVCVPPREDVGELLLLVVVCLGVLEVVGVELDVEVEVEVEGGGVVVVCGGVEVVVVCGQDSDTLVTPAGSDRLESGAPTGRE